MGEKSDCKSNSGGVTSNSVELAAYPAPIQVLLDYVRDHGPRPTAPVARSNRTLGSYLLPTETRKRMH